MRAKNSLKNIFFNIGGQILILLSKFITQKVFIDFLGVEYLGANSLIVNIISLLNITELGISTAITFSLYKPLAEQNNEKIKSIVYLYKKFYIFVGCLILLLGLLLTFFLQNFITTTIDIGVIKRIYILYLIQSVFSYFFMSYKSTILIADQKNYLVNLRYNIVTFLANIMQIIIIYSTKSWYLYVIVLVVSTILKNIWVGKKVDRLYPFIKEKKYKKLQEDEKIELYKNILGISTYKLSGTVLTSTDNVIISKFLNVTITGIYSNYQIISNALTNFINIIFSSITSSIGNLNVTEDCNKKEEIFNCLFLFDSWLCGFCSISLICLYNQFIGIYFGKNYIFSLFIVILIVLNFLTDGMNNVVTVYKDACGLFWKGKVRPIISASLNLIISFFLVKSMGVAGVILGTILSRFMITWWYDSNLIYRHVFEKGALSYYLKYTKYLFVTIFLGVITYSLCMPFMDYTIFGFIICLFICIFFPNMFYFIFFKNTKEFKILYKYIKNIKDHYPKSKKTE